MVIPLFRFQLALEFVDDGNLVQFLPDRNLDVFVHAWQLRLPTVDVSPGRIVLANDRVAVGIVRVVRLSLGMRSAEVAAQVGEFAGR